MTKKILVAGLAAVCIFSTACGKKDTAAGGGTTADATKTYKYYVYTLNYGANSISGFSLDTSTGGLTAVSGSPFTLGVTAASGAIGFAVDATNKFAYASVFKTGDVKVFSIAKATGVLTENATGGVTASTGIYGMAMDPSGKSLYVLDYFFSQIYGYSPSATDGKLTALSGFPMNQNPYSYGLNGVFDAQGKYLYVAELINGTVGVYTRDATTGMLTSSGTEVVAASGPNSVALSPNGKFLYSVNGQNVGGLANSISTFSVSSTDGSLTRVGSDVSTGGTSPLQMAIAPSGNFAYVVNQPSGSIGGFSVNSTTGVLTALSPQLTSATGLKPADLVFDPSGKYLYVANNGPGTISTYTVDSSTGALTLVAGTSNTTGQGPAVIRLVKIEQ